MAAFMAACIAVVIPEPEPEPELVPVPVPIGLWINDIGAGQYFTLPPVSGGNFW